MTDCRRTRHPANEFSFCWMICESPKKYALGNLNEFLAGCACVREKNHDHLLQIDIFRLHGRCVLQSGAKNLIALFESDSKVIENRFTKPLMTFFNL